ncbi:4-(cytidine 5'-diphospho)-2-C-methyl-D-erythritol kinase [Aestuariivirga litoralis]|uniref:4-(cytidine 5'-diphospho)-2-C-methyl-D-erythritol kinase n=1 Tax=Aestuariivirga litoralis TaxID=2650924 RepID=UPI0018C82E62|nr:4-(cytidine 5'-diphospho)-2-C-methyl-D-erythritol kinase [Aestuariivirga litoralis]MBG1233098.1 4-(cytidine 5'-diphospho)-2-C-methyl-D-erythritol kinase [Aestuariivirga litoralis]
MSSIVESARAKVNLTLHVKGRRADGYHELSSIVAFADVADKLVLEPAAANALVVSGPFAADVPSGDDNIIWKAWAHLGTLMDVPFVSVQLEKNLPVASGIGGGSADAAAMLRGLLKLSGQSLDAAQIAGLSAIGADVPVCFQGQPCLMQGIGDQLEPLKKELPPAIVLANPLLPCATAAVFKAMGIAPGAVHRGGRGLWRNDMTQAALTVQPAIAAVLSELKNTKLTPCLMSGSGATCFGLAQSFAQAEEEAERLRQAYPGWWIKAARLA